ncbi:MAG: hypothetical protein IRY99_00210 [Isosphaeraceae bacterium]|nr:hypothetical protein [Isosphaeraceae bacterium]
MSVATTLHPPAAVYREEQNFGWWVYALLALMALLGVAGLAWARPGPAPPVAPPDRWTIEVPLGLAVGLVLPVTLIIGVLRMTTEVRPGECRVWFGWIPTYRRFIPLEDVRRIEVVRYRPIRDFLFWGVRVGRDGERALIARGDRGVRLHFADGSRLLIGSQRPEALAVALERAMRPGS